MKEILGIVGGIGPLSTAYFYEKIILSTKVDKDQDHIDMIILNHASMPDRTDYILNNSDVSPLPDLINDINFLTNSGAKLIAIPCNTACYFYDEMVKVTDVPILNIVEETVINLKENGIKKVAILATTGTIEANLYQQVCKKYNIECLTPDENTQNQVMDIIYNKIKKGEEVDKNNLINLCKKLEEKGSEKIILGCTELSVLKKELKLDDMFIDPLDLLVNKILLFFNKETK